MFARSSDSGKLERVASVEQLAPAAGSATWGREQLLFAARSAILLQANDEIPWVGTIPAFPVRTAGCIVAMLSLLAIASGQTVRFHFVS